MNKSGPTFEDRDQKPAVMIIGPDQNQVGGVSTFIKILTSSQTLKRDFDLVLLNTARRQRDLGLENKFSILNLSYMFRQTVEFIKIAIRRQPKLVHIQFTSSLSFLKGAAFALLGQGFRMKAIGHLHGGRFDKYYRQSGFIQQKFIGWVFHRMDVIIALSERWRRFILEEIRPDINVRVIHNTIDPMFAQALNDMNNDLSKKEKIVLFLGALGTRKGVYDILKAIPLVHDEEPDALFLFAGEEESRGEKTRIDQFCKDGSLCDNVQFLGNITGQAKLELFERAMLYILPSYGENLPYALLEAMSVGLPIITTPVGAIPEIIREGRNGLMIQPGDYKTLAKCIVMLLHDSDLREKMSHENIETIRENFLPEAAMGLFNNLYRQLILDDK